MRVGVPKEIKTEEYRVGLTPAGVRALVQAGHAVTVERGAGEGSGFEDAAYRYAGAELGDAAAAWSTDLVVKVKEPQPDEYAYLRGQIVFTYFHLAAAPCELLDALLESGTTAVAYETLEDEQGHLPLLAPMSGVAGNMATLMGAYYLARFNGGRGTLPANVLGVGYGRVLIIGDGVVARHAAQRACAMGTEVVMAGLDPSRAADLQAQYPDCFRFVHSSPQTIAAEITAADLVVGAVLIRGARAPHVVTEDMVRRMAAGAVIVDVSIDQGGCVATSRPTTHADPVYTVHGVIHYCVTNMPGAYPRTSTLALTRATLPYVLRLADRGIEAVRGDPGFAKAVNTYRGWITCRPVAESWGLPERYRPLEALLEESS
ncbi:alanine dehydrogenase [Methylomarinovum tepidoasis]|uniref:Alanine dehydrogenase n=1 Tax=Methylomarinovum tepidoasis TaxID=2840183 RepID=A0AAU9D1B6_9GAMM|nr:alanine dehydrogenase [Methylomarinovum sp. IN45]BCX88779.1 alanine dehydrogenase [Methylomarinovum sp. IN45]